MDEKIYRTIYNTLSLRETEDLLRIWQINDRVEWEDSTFEIIENILQNREIDLPLQNTPIFEHKISKGNEFDPIKENSKYLDPANAPEFYNPKDVLWLVKKIKQASIILIGIYIVFSLISIFNLLQSILSIFNGPMWAPNWAMIINLIISFINNIGSLLLTSIIIYVPLKGLGDILKILTQMEFHSRGIE